MGLDGRQIRTYQRMRCCVLLLLPTLVLADFWTDKLNQAIRQDQEDVSML